MQKFTHAYIILLVLFPLPIQHLFFSNSHSLLSPICLPLVLLQLLFCSSMKRFPFLSVLHLFPSPPTPNADTAEGISHSSVGFLSSSPAFSLSVSFHLCLYFPPSQPSSRTISPCTNGSFCTLREHPSFCSVKRGKKQYYLLLFVAAFFSPQLQRIRF